MAIKSSVSVKRSCDFVISSVRNSFLNYSIKETPFSLYFTLRKSFAKPSSNLEHIFSHSVQNGGLEQPEVEALTIKLKAAEESNMILKNDYEVAVNDCERCYKRISELESRVEDLKEEINHYEADKQASDKIECENLNKDKLVDQLKQDKSNLECDIEIAEKNWKALNKTLKSKDKEIHDLIKENEIKAENLVKVKADFAQANKEKKNEERKQKKRDKNDFIEGLKANSFSVAFECCKCDTKLESLKHLKCHERMFHMVTNSVQTDDKEVEDKIVQSCWNESLVDKEVQTNEEKVLEVEKYPCFYCGINIVSENHLNEHRRKCRGTSKMFGELGLPPPMPFGFATVFPPAPQPKMSLFGLTQPTLFY